MSIRLTAARTQKPDSPNEIGGNFQKNARHHHNGAQRSKFRTHLRPHTTDDVGTFLIRGFVLKPPRGDSNTPQQ